MDANKDMSISARVGRYGAAATALALYGDRELGELLATATPLGHGIGGQVSLLEVDGVPVFVKRVPLCAVELEPENVRSTANVFGLPAFFQYGIGSPGFGAWRELATHEMTSNWVLTGESGSFPLMYHWRVLPTEGAPSGGASDKVEEMVEYWGGGDAVRERFEALARSTSSVTLFLEYIPRNLSEWLTAELAVGAESAERAFAMVERELAEGVSFMNGHGLLHFDAHTWNILTDGERLYFADYGLALSERFALDAEEAEFFRRHVDTEYDRNLTAMHLIRLFGETEAAAGIVKTYAGVAEVLGGFLGELRQGRHETTYPEGELRSLAPDGPYRRPHPGTPLRPLA